MLNTNINNRFDLWLMLERWQANQLVETEIDELQDVLVKRPLLFEQANEYFQIDAELKNFLIPEDLNKTLETFIHRTQVNASSLHPSSQTRVPLSISAKSISATSKSSSHWKWLFYSTAFISITFLTCYFLMFNHSYSGQQIDDWTKSSYIISEISKTITNKTKLNAGFGLCPGHFDIPSGILKLSSSHGILLHIQGPAVFEIVDQSHIKMSSGLIGAYVPENATGFTVTTPNGKIVDRGTVFWVNHSYQGSEVYVQQGKVDITGNATQNQPVTIYASEKEQVLLQEKRLTYNHPVNDEFNISLTANKLPATTGNVAFMHNTIHNLEPGKTEDNHLIRVYKEGTTRKLQAPIHVDVLQTGDYATVPKWKSLLNSGNMLPKGTSLQSYFVHYDPQGNANKYNSVGSITFPGKIMGIIALRNTLQLTHPILGTTSLHPSGIASAKNLHGIDPAIHELDKVILSKDRKTVTFMLHAGEHQDQLRILVEEH